jgi:hypothetical protein
LVVAGIDTPVAESASPLRLSRCLALDSGANTIEVVADSSANMIASCSRAPVSRRLELPSYRYSATIFLEFTYSFD